MSLGERIRNRRKEIGLTQIIIAEHLGMGRSNFGHIENDRVIPSSTDLEKIATILKTTPNYLLGNSDQKETITDNADVPDWATNKDIADFRKMLENDQPVLFDGVPIEGEKRQRVLDILSGLFWEAKELNKETYGKKRNSKKPNDQDSKE
ncbi:helix-turn-helix transcriptional regulator [Paenibacillus sp. FSL R5-0517]|uniref:helix-turn-helix domain-containing protein n=1 Tax=Paenibacillus sp. FSL R5-0517 TaxID=2921647 RepID=UPI0030DDD041